eukprot:TRINITY_DN1569_c0_g1_i3.p1 TRINITY_DN1569_c0_g1~~TRINITY_DN1569_c0_g1_i3.p1  ORF type:complete len:184 (-),score=13.55 TRINITY_DN1569_c0_g1_i3:75-626(-)
MNSASSNESKDRVSSPQTTNTTTSPKERVDEIMFVACNHIQSSTGQLPLKPLRTTKRRPETKTYNTLEFSSTLLQSKERDRPIKDDKALADSKERLFKTLFLAGLYFPSSSPFQPVVATKDQINCFRSKIYRSVQECKTKEHSDCLFSQQAPKTAAQFPQSKKSSHSNTSSTCLLYTSPSPRD